MLLPDIPLWTVPISALPKLQSSGAGRLLGL